MTGGAGFLGQQLIRSLLQRYPTASILAADTVAAPSIDPRVASRVGTAFLLYVLGKRFLGFLWKWSQPTPTRRVAGVLGTVGMFALLAFLWAPQLPAFFPGGGESGGPLYQQANANFRPMRSPILPKTSAPNGRTANPTAKVASVFRKLTVALPSG